LFPPPVVLRSYTLC